MQKVGVWSALSMAFGVDTAVAESHLEHSAPARVPYVSRGRRNEPPEAANRR
jgi:hypothetical protein